MKKIIIANWKMGLTFKETQFLLEKISTFEAYRHFLIVCPDFLNLAQATQILKDTKIKTGGQNCSFHHHGAYTGEISALDIKAAGAEYVIIGHSERRRIFKEDNSMINQKIKIALEAKLKPILCLGESLLERKTGRTRPVLSSQLKNALKGIKIRKASDLLLAYEPVWAIGSGQPMESEEAERMHKYIAERAFALTGKRLAVIYGGSVKPDNAHDFIKQKNIAGLLVGGASLQAKSLKLLLNI
ncbi:MAG: triose-phosphate isomerase [Patescibacteria group bacterium]|nr:triose-phosphate isomerase [Patescibacteria group bacterium]NCU39457.1 triose-phosphate isomerase [Candidatus Falkowbacteria bacterium]